MSNGFVQNVISLKAINLMSTTRKKELTKTFEEKHGRKPPELTPQQISKLEEAFFHGASDSEAYSYADVCATNFYWWQEVNPEFVERKKQLQESIKLRSKMNVVKSIHDGNVNDSKFWLTTKCKDEFSTRTESTGKDGQELSHPIIKVEFVEPKK